MTTKQSILWTGVMLYAAGSALASVPDAPEFGWIGGGQGQVLRVNVMAVDAPALVSVAFQDLLGRQVGPPTKLMRLLPGQFDDLELNFSNTGKGRVYVRPIVKYLEGSGMAMITTEFYDEFLGRTGARSPIGQRGINFTPIGLAYGQTMRLAISASTRPCVGSINFHRGNGEAVGTHLRVALQPGQWTFREIDGTQLLRFGQNEDFLPAVQVDGGAAGCVADVQVYDQATGWTNLFVTGAAR